MVGQLGYLEIASVGLANQIFFILVIVLFGTVSGGSIFISQFWGKKNLAGIHMTMGIIFILASFVSVLFFCAALFFPEFCLSIYSNDKDVIRQGSEYLKAIAPSYIFTGIGLAFSQAERSTERVKLPLIATGSSVIINAVLNYLLIFGVKFDGITDVQGVVLIPPMGIVGAAIATDIARVVEFIILVAVPFIRKYEIAAGLKKYFSIQTDFLPRYIKVCLPVLVNEILWGFGTSMQSSVYAHSGTSVIAAFNITSTIANLVWTFFIGCGCAAAIIIGKKIGESNHDEARYLAKKISAFMAVMGFCLGLLLIPLSFCLSFMFKVEMQVLKMAQIFLFMTAILYPFCAFNMCMIVGICRSGADTLFGMFIDVGFLWLFCLPMGFCAVNFWNAPFWLIFIFLRFDDILKTGFGLFRLFSGKWLKDVTVNTST